MDSRLRRILAFVIKGRRTPERRWRLLVDAARYLLPTYKLTWPELEWFDDEPFSKYLERFSEHEDFNSARRWALYQLIRLTAAVEGDTVECGAYVGASSYLICASNAQGVHKRTHHVFDSFEGLSQPAADDGEYWIKGDLAVPLDRIKANLEKFGGAVSYYKGWIPDRFSEVADRQFSFVHIDVDIYHPTRDSIEFFYPRLSPGGILICDDYMFATCPGATKAIDEFLADKPEKMVSLSAGGGFLIKQIETSERASLV